jgi:hypothetical protein
MERTVTIDERLLDEARRAAGAIDDRQVVEMGLRELVRRQQVKALVDSFGTFDLDMTDEDLRRLRQLEIKRLEFDE